MSGPILNEERVHRGGRGGHTHTEQAEAGGMTRFCLLGESSGPARLDHSVLDSEDSEDGPSLDPLCFL